MGIYITIQFHFNSTIICCLGCRLLFLLQKFNLPVPLLLLLVEVLAGTIIKHLKVLFQVLPGSGRVQKQVYQMEQVLYNFSSILISIVSYKTARAAKFRPIYCGSTLVLSKYSYFGILYGKIQLSGVQISTVKTLVCPQ